MTRNGVITTKVRLLRAVVHLISIALLLIIVAVVTRQSGPQLAQLRCVIRRVQDVPKHLDIIVLWELQHRLKDAEPGPITTFILP